MGGCSVLILLGILASVGIVFLTVFLGALGLFIAAVIITIVFAVGTKRRKAEGRKLGALVAIPVILYVISIPVLLFSTVTVIVPTVVSSVTLDYDDAAEAVRTGDTNRLIACLDSLSFSFDAEQGDTPEDLLYIAITYERSESVDVLLDWLEEHDTPIDLNSPIPRYGTTDDFWQPIIEASDTHASMDVVTVLAEHGADVNAIEPETGWTPLMYACFGEFDRALFNDGYEDRLSNTEDAIDVLLNHGANPSIVAKDGTTSWELYEQYVGSLISIDGASDNEGISQERADGTLERYQDVLGADDNNQ